MKGKATMKLATTTEDFTRFSCSICDSLTYIAEAGFRYVDLNQYVPKLYPELFGDNWKNEVKKIKEQAESLGLTFVQSHSPGMNPFDKDADYNYIVDCVKRSVEVCGMLGIKNTVLHNGYDRNIKSKDEFTEKNIKFFSEFLPLAQENGVNILCENTTYKNMPDWYFPVSGNQLLDFVKDMGHPLVHACWDTGHCNCEGNQYEHILALGKELYALHINDNSGRGDEHVIPYFGTLNMDDVMHGLIDSGYNGYFTFESGMSLRPAKYWQGNRQAFENDTRLCEPQLFMQKRVESLMYEIGEYILRQYDCFEE